MARGRRSRGSRRAKTVRSSRMKFKSKVVTRGPGAKRGTVGEGFGLQIVPSLE